MVQRILTISKGLYTTREQLLCPRDFCYLHYMKRAFSIIIVILLGLGMIAMFLPGLASLTR